MKMNKYQIITSLFEEKYKPVKALLVYTSNISKAPPYVESYDIDHNGYPINAHPLSMQEIRGLQRSLTYAEENERNNYLTAKGIIPEKVLHINYSEGQVVWYTPTQNKLLHFTKDTGLKEGHANVPALIWKASRKKLSVWALANNRKKRPNITETLYKAPFFNIYEDASVCMGSVDTFEKKQGNLEFFMEYWETAFWNSSFSHLNIETSPVKGNIIQLWTNLLDTTKPFPITRLLPDGKKLNEIF